MKIPEQFKNRMKNLLGEEYPEFCEALETASAVRALRLNKNKISRKIFEEKIGFPVEKPGFLSDGYTFAEEKVGGDPLHHAGAFYVQDPSAMSAVEGAKKYIKKGMRALDLCAAPGGKSTQLAEYVGEEGILVSNEIVKKRAAVLRGNLERMGCRNAVLCSADSDTAAKDFPEYFDFVLCDAPCSGEGMMRKYEEAVSEWSEENVVMCAARQREILNNAAKCVAGGGYLLYSTCTFSVEENEDTIRYFLETHPGFSILPFSDEIVKVTSPAIYPELACCRRFYPHKAPGEGQFMCLMQKNCGERRDFSIKKSPLVPLTRDEKNIAEDFFKNNLGGVPLGKKLCSLRGNVMLVPEVVPCTDSTVFAGVCAGEVIKGRFEPHHHLFSAYGRDFLRRVELSADSPEIFAYLKGETVQCDTENGWCAVLVEGCPLGGGKAVNGILKNHYPKGLRTR